MEENKTVDAFSCFQYIKKLESDFKKLKDEKHGEDDESIELFKDGAKDIFKKASVEVKNSGK